MRIDSAGSVDLTDNSDEWAWRIDHHHREPAVLRRQCGSYGPGALDDLSR